MNKRRVLPKMYAQSRSPNTIITIAAQNKGNGPTLYHIMMLNITSLGYIIICFYAAFINIILLCTFY